MLENRTGSYVKLQRQWRDGAAGRRKCILSDGESARLVCVVLHEAQGQVDGRRFCLWALLHMIDPPVLTLAWINSCRNQPLPHIKPHPEKHTLLHPSWLLFNSINPFFNVSCFTFTIYHPSIILSFVSISWTLIILQQLYHLILFFFLINDFLHVFSAGHQVLLCPRGNNLQLSLGRNSETDHLCS